MNFNDPFSHGAYLLWSGGALKFDIVETEKVMRDADITDHPVEVGANVTDHYRIKPNLIKIEAFVSQCPVDPSIYPDAQGSVQGVELALTPYPAAGLAAAGVANPLTLLNTPPTSFVQQALAYANPIDTLALVLGTLEDLRTNATLLDVATRSWYYSQFLLGPIETERDEKTGDGTKITLELKQVLFVSTDAVAAPPIPVQKKDTPLTDKGKQNGTVPGTQSAAAKLLDTIFPSQSSSTPLSGASSFGVGNFRLF